MKIKISQIKVTLLFSPTLCSKSFNSTRTKNVQMYKLDLEKTEEPGIKLPTSIGSLKRQDNSMKNIYFFFFDYAKAYYCVDHSKLWKILQDMGITDHLTCLLRDLYAGQEATVKTGRGTIELDMELVPNWERSTSRLYIITLFI